MATKEQIMETIGNMNSSELRQLIKDFEKKFGISASVSAPSVVGLPSQLIENEGIEAEGRGKSYNVVLVSAGTRRIAVIKEVLDITNTSLMDARDLVDEAPKPVKEDLFFDDALSIRRRLESVGATVKIEEWSG